MEGRLRFSWEGWEEFPGYDIVLYLDGLCITQVDAFFNVYMQQSTPMIFAFHVHFYVNVTSTEKDCK